MNLTITLTLTKRALTLAENSNQFAAQLVQDGASNCFCNLAFSSERHQTPYSERWHLQTGEEGVVWCIIDLHELTWGNMSPCP